MDLARLGDKRCPAAVKLGGEDRVRDGLLELLGGELQACGVRHPLGLPSVPLPAGSYAPEVSPA
jgi:hypothetical protein